ncbi:MAG: large subunit ribosomal protein L4 [Candidatus Binatia bacterium]
MSENSSIDTAVVNASGTEVSRIALPSMFGVEVRDYLLFEQVIAQRASSRGGNASVKSRGEVRGGGKKPWRQKGTGRARAGSSRSPIWRGGGTTHGPQPRSYAYRLPRSARRAALECALAQKQRDDQLKVIDELKMETPSTKALRATLENLGVLSGVLIIVTERDEVLELSARNLPYVVVLPVAGLNVHDIIRYENLLVTKDALAAIEERLT